MTHHDRPYGVGLAYRHLLHDPIMQRAEEIDLLEVSTEDYLVRQRRIWADPNRKLLSQIVERFPCVAHGISLSLGSVEPLDQRYLAGTAEFLRETGIQHFSEHLAFQRMDEVDLTIFLALPFNDVAAAWVAHNYEIVRRAIGAPIALENVSYYFAAPRSQYREPRFLVEVLRRTNGTLLLDVTNVYNNCVNHGQDPYEYIHELPPDRVSQIHLAGGHYEDGFLIDSHSQPVMEPVWELYEEALRHTRAEITILERDENLQPFSAVMKDVHKARELFFKHRASHPPERESAASRAELAGDVPSGEATLLAEFSNLRNFQRAIIRQVRDPEFWKRVCQSPRSVLDDYPMDEEWYGRWRDCSAEELSRLAKRWQWFQSQDARAAEEYRRIEWQEWAWQLERESW